MDAFIQEMRYLRDSIAPLASEFGVFQVRPVYLVTRENNADCYEEILPTPVVDEISFDLRSVEDVSSLQGMQKVFQIRGISQKYARENIENQFVEFEILDGVRCTLIDIERSTLTWNLRVVQKLGNQNIYR